jgi:hypothetical protein
MSDLTEFERGAMLAVELLKTQIDARTDALRNLPVDNDTSGVLNGVHNVLMGMRIKFESELAKRLGEERHKQYTRTQELLGNRPPLPKSKLPKPKPVK